MKKFIKEMLIANENPLNLPNIKNYKKFNDFIFSNDLKLIGKLLYRFQFFLDVKNLPGDIVEIGVFKGSGVSSFLKFIQIFCPNSNKKIIGFDIFDAFNANIILNKDSISDRENMDTVYARTNRKELSLKSVTTRLENINVDNSKFKLIQGDIEKTIPIFVKENPGFRASLIYMDVDLERPTYNALNHLWDKLLPGGIIIFDEYEYHKFTESDGVEKFLKERNIQFNLKSTNWIAPTAYLIKTEF
jgi:hypothetical protein